MEGGWQNVRPLSDSSTGIADFSVFFSNSKRHSPTELTF